MSGIGYYEELIDECNLRIRKYEGQVEGLEAFEKENENGTETFSGITYQRRANLETSFADSIKHPMVMKLYRKINQAIDKDYENSVLDYFYSIKNEIQRAINQLKEEIKEEQERISYYKSAIAELLEEERNQERN